MTVVPRRSPRHCSGALRRIPAIGRQSERRYGSERRKNGDGFPVPHANHQQCADDMAGTGRSTEPGGGERERVASSQGKRKRRSKKKPPVAGRGGFGRGREAGDISRGS